MKVEVSFIPEYERLQESVAIAQKYHAHFEYNDFYLPSVYTDEEEVDRRIKAYLSCGRDTGMDTMHGVFLDMTVHSSDPNIAAYSKKRIRQSLEIGRRLGVKGIVFHTGLIAGFKEQSYVSNWLSVNVDFFQKICMEYPDLNVYMENMFDRDEELLYQLAERMKDMPNFGICLDYAHAAISDVAPSRWFERCAPYIRHMHINDNDLVNDLHLPLGSGKIDWQEFSKELKRLYENGELKELPSILLELKSLEAFEESIAVFYKLFE